jgi:hypothetical protein
MSIRSPLCHHELLHCSGIRIIHLLLFGKRLGFEYRRGLRICRLDLRDLRVQRVYPGGGIRPDAYRSA